MTVAAGQRVRVIAGRYTGFVGVIDQIQTNGVAVVLIDGVEDQDLRLEPDDSIKLGVAIEKLECVALPRPPEPRRHEQ